MLALNLLHLFAEADVAKATFAKAELVKAQPLSCSAAQHVNSHVCADLLPRVWIRVRVLLGLGHLFRDLYLSVCL